MNETARSNQYIPTEQFAALYGVKSDTVRRNLCIKGHFLGVKPLKLGNRRLLWPNIPPEQLCKEA